MFEFDEELFNRAYIENLRLLQNLNANKRIINIVNSINGSYDGQGEVSSILNDLNHVIKVVNNLDRDMRRTKLLFKRTSSFSGGLRLNTLRRSLRKFFCFDTDNVGEYGANQNYPYLLYKVFLQNPEKLNEIYRKKVDVVEKVFKNYKYAKVNDNLIYFSLLAFGNGGCGVSAVSNIIIDYYSRCDNGDELFEKKYGFPLYYVDTKQNKHYNYEGIFVKTYLDAIEKETNATPLNYCLNLLGMGSIKRSYIPYLDDTMTYGRTAAKAIGLTPSSVSNLLKNELPAGVTVDKSSYGLGLVSMVGIDSKWDEVQTALKENIGKYDYCIVGAHSFEMRALDDNYIKNNNGEELYSNIAGHFLLVTDISKNGNPIVSSWGYKFELTNSAQTDLLFVNLGD